MTGWLLDTNVVSELRRPGANPTVLAFIAAQPIQSLYTSPVVLAEIRLGIEMPDDPDQRAGLVHWLDRRVRPLFAQRVLPIDEDVMLTWGRLARAGRKRGHTYAQPDLILAATALHHGLTLVTRNTRDFPHTGVPLKDPWLA